LLDGSPIVLIATYGNTGKKANGKTGAMVQTYILRSDIGPIEAIRSGGDAAICGECPHRPKKNGTCYVRVDTGPNMVYKAFKRGSAYHDATQCNLNLSRLFAGELIRLGTYGDPAAIPLSVWSALLKAAGGWTGYTHQWKRSDSQGLKAFCMASCDTLEEDREARGMGWRTFTVLIKGAKAVPGGSFLCPASEEAGKKLTCSECLACDGLSSERKASVYIPVHGVAFKQVRFNSLIQIGRV
jgi:hypothetical protein